MKFGKKNKGTVVSIATHRDVKWEDESVGTRCCGLQNTQKLGLAIGTFEVNILRNKQVAIALAMARSPSEIHEMVGSNN